MSADRKLTPYRHHGDPSGLLILLNRDPGIPQPIIEGTPVPKHRATLAKAFLPRGSRLKQSTALVNAVEGRTILEFLGSPDDLKFQSSMRWSQRILHQEMPC